MVFSWSYTKTPVATNIVSSVRNTGVKIIPADKNIVCHSLKFSLCKFLMYSNIARNCPYSTMRVRILPHGTVITHTIKRFVSFLNLRRNIGGFYLSLLSVLSCISCQFCLFAHIFSSGPDLNEHSFTTSFLGSAYIKRHFMHSEPRALFFYIMSSLLFIYHIFSFTFYLQIPLLLGTVGLCHSLDPQHVAFISVGLLPLFIIFCYFWPCDIH